MENTEQEVQILEEKKVITIQRLNKIQFGGLSIYPKAATVFGAELDQNGLYKTGLTEKEERHYEKELGLKEGALKRNNKEFWGSFSIRIAGKSLRLDPENVPMDFLKHKVCLSTSKVANSVTDKHKYPDALFVIFDEEEDAKKENVKISAKRKAYAKFGEMSTEDMRGILKIIGKKKPENVYNEVVENVLANFVETEPARFMTLVADPLKNTKILIDDLISLGIITKSGSYFKHGDDPIGNSTDEVAMYLEDPKNQTLLVSLKGRVKKKK